MFQHNLVLATHNFRAKVTKDKGSILYKRCFMELVKNALGLDPPLGPDVPQISNRFYPWDKSPSPEIRERAAKIKSIAKCPVTGLDIRYTCPLSGIPTHHSKEAWEQDTNYHQNKIYEYLKKVNIYEHDLRSGRSFPELEFPNEQTRDRAVNLEHWDLFFYTRQFYSMDTEFQLAAATKMLSYPISIASILHEYSPYGLQPKGPITLEGLKSIAALRYILYPQILKSDLNDKKPMRIFIVGARAESQLPGHVWKQLQYLFPKKKLDLIFIGPESCLLEGNLEKIPIERHVDPTLRLFYYPNYFHELHHAQDFFPYDPYNDVFFLFHPGFANEELKPYWFNDTLPNLLDTKCAIFHTGLHENDIMKDTQLLQKEFGDKLDTLITPTKNVFGSTKWELNDYNPQEVYQFNMYLAGFRGKRYQTVKY